MLILEKLLNKLLNKRQERRDAFFEGVVPDTREALGVALGYDRALTDEIQALEKLLKGDE